MSYGLTPATSGALTSSASTSSAPQSTQSFSASQNCEPVFYTGATTTRSLSTINSEVSTIPREDQHSEKQSDIADRKTTHVIEKCIVPKFEQKVRITTEISDEPAVKPEDVMDMKINERLKTIKEKYEKQFSFIKRHFTTNNFCNLDSTEPLIVNTTGKKMGEFVNEYHSDEWQFLANNKNPEYRHNFYASNIIVHQYEYISEVNQAKLALPKTIIENKITGEKSIEVIHKYVGRHDSEQFRHEYLTTTVNGKRTAKVLEDFGLIIEGMEVNYDKYEMDTKHYPGAMLARIKLIYPYFNVTYHVRPDPEVYGNPHSAGSSSS